MFGLSFVELLPLALASAVAALAYLAPAIVALALRRPRRGAIVAINILAGWTVLGWVAALVWALRRPDAPVPASRVRG